MSTCRACSKPSANIVTIEGICDECLPSPKKPHKHAELIKAWADGAQIEYRRGYYGPTEWTPQENPGWYGDTEYRVKPQPHKWQKEIDAWNAGKEVQYQVGVEWEIFRCTPPNINVPGAGNFDTPGLEWRIKPERVVVSCYITHGGAFKETVLVPATASEGANLELTFEDGKLVHSVVLKPQKV